MAIDADTGYKSIDGQVALTEDECNLIYYVLGDALDTYTRVLPTRLDGGAGRLTTYAGLREKIGLKWDELREQQHNDDTEDDPFWTEEEE
jgi:hypothetical protein